MPEFAAVPPKVSIIDPSSCESDSGDTSESDENAAEVDANATAATYVVNERPKKKKKKKKKIDESLANVVLPPGFLDPLPLKDRSFSSSAPLDSAVPAPSASKEHASLSVDDNSKKFSKVGDNKGAGPSLGNCWLTGHIMGKSRAKKVGEIANEIEEKWFEEVADGSSPNDDGYGRTLILNGPTWKGVEVSRSRPITHKDWLSKGPHVVRYSCKGVTIDFPFVDEMDRNMIMKYQPPRVTVAGEWSDAAITAEVGDPQYLSTRSSILPENLEKIRKEYSLRDEYQLHVPSKNQVVCDVPQGCMAVYVHQLRAGLRFPLHPLYKDILQYWKLQLGQLSPNAVRTIVGFLLMCKSCSEPVTLELFRYYFLISQRYSNSETRGYFYFQKRSTACCPILLIQSGVHSWKDKFFFIKNKGFEEGGMLYCWNKMKTLNNTFDPSGVEGEAMNASIKLKVIKAALPTEGVWPVGLIRIAGLERGFKPSLIALRAAVVALVAAYAEKKDQGKEQEDVSEETDVPLGSLRKGGDAAKEKKVVKGAVVTTTPESRIKHVATKKTGTKVVDLKTTKDIAASRAAIAGLIMRMKRKRSSTKTPGPTMAKRKKIEGPVEPLPPIAEETDSMMEQFEASEVERIPHDHDTYREEIRGPAAEMESLPTDVGTSVVYPEIPTKTSFPRKGVNLAVLQKIMGREGPMPPPNVREEDTPGREDLRGPGSSRGTDQADEEAERNCDAGELISWMSSMLSNAYMPSAAYYMETLKDADLTRLSADISCLQLFTTMEKWRRTSSQSARISELETELVKVKEESECKIQKEKEKVQQLQEELDKSTQNLLDKCEMLSHMKKEVNRLDFFITKAEHLEKVEGELRAQLAAKDKKMKEAATNKDKKLKEALAKQEVDLEAKYLKRETALTTQLSAVEAKIVEIEECAKKWQEGYVIEHSGREKWEKEAKRLSQRYEDEDGNLKFEVQRDIVMSFLTSEEGKNLLTRYDLQIVHEAFTVADQCLKAKDKNLELPETYRGFLKGFGSKLPKPWEDGFNWDEATSQVEVSDDDGDDEDMASLPNETASANGSPPNDL